MREISLPAIITFLQFFILKEKRKVKTKFKVQINKTFNLKMENKQFSVIEIFAYEQLYNV